LPVGPKPVDLDEGAGQLLRFPGRSGFAGQQPHRNILDPHRLARPQRQVAHDTVTLVEQSQNGDALGHGGHPRLLSCRARDVDRNRVVFACLVAAVAAAYGQQQNDRKEGGRTGHAYSGFQAS
jgi:hypothetical protein